MTVVVVYTDGDTEQWYGQMGGSTASAGSSTVLCRRQTGEGGEGGQAGMTSPSIG